MVISHTFLAEKYVEISILLYRYKLGDSLLLFFDHDNTFLFT